MSSSTGGRRLARHAGRIVTDAGQQRLLIVSPVRNEAAHIERVIEGIAAQTVKPARWIVVDDASTDDTLSLLRAHERELDILTVIARRPSADLDRSADRLARAAAPRAFNAGLAHAGTSRATATS
ncbi:MAG: glycosyltransferase family A protein [Solirubrobacterales bacterium]